MNIFTLFCCGIPQSGSPQPSTQSYIVNEGHTALEYETEIIKRHMEAKMTTPHFTGRGGRGNMTNPTYGKQYQDSIAQNDGEVLSRHPGAKAELSYSSGRGGFGNIASPKQPGIIDQSQVADLEYEKKIIKRHRDAVGDKPYLCGRGGIGNVAGPIPRSTESHSRLASTSSTSAIHDRVPSVR